MKKLFLVLVALFFSTILFSQQTTEQKLSKESYLLKSKKQKKTGFILLATGTAALATALIIPRGDYTGDVSLPYLQDEYENDGIRAAFGLVGVVAMVASVPFFIVSGNNKRKAMAIVLHKEKILMVTSEKYFTVQQTLSLQVSF